MKRQRLGDPTITITTAYEDIGGAKCANRAQCVIARAWDRTFRLGGTGYILVDSNSVGITANGERYRYYPPKSSINYLRKFDEIGATQGEDTARLTVQPRTFTFKLQEVRPIAPKSSPTRRARINQLRNARNAALRAAGISRTKHPRYAGI